MSMFAELWRRRERHNSFAEFARGWAKRAATAPSIIQNDRRITKLRKRGAQIGTLAMLGESELIGSAKHLSIANGSSLGRCRIELQDDVTIGACVAINDGVWLLTASHSLTDPQWRTFTRPIRIMDMAWIATNAIILPGVTIGYGAVVAAGAVVRVDVPPLALAIGNPAEILLGRRGGVLTYEPARLRPPVSAWLGKPASYDPSARQPS